MTGRAALEKPAQHRHCPDFGFLVASAIRCPAVGWLSKERQIATIVLVIGALIALFVFDVSAAFWVLIAASLLLAAVDLWQKRRLRSH